MLFALSGANCFSVAPNTRPVLFIMMIVSYNCVPGTCYSYTVVLLSVWISSSSTPSLSPLIATLILFYLVSLSLSYPPLLHRASLPYLSSISLLLPSHLFALVSSLPALSSASLQWAACNHVCTTSCQFDRIHAPVFCHLRRKRDWSFLTYLSHISGGRISMKSI